MTTTTALLALLLAPLLLPLLMLAWYAVAIQCQRGGLWRLLLPFAWLGYMLDVALQATVMDLYFQETAPSGERTVTDRIGRLQSDLGWRGTAARRLARLLNAIAPRVHIPGGTQIG